MKLEPKDIKSPSPSDSPEKSLMKQEVQKMQQLTLSKWELISPGSLARLVRQTLSCGAPLHSLGQNRHDGESVIFIIFIDINYSLL